MAYNTVDIKSAVKMIGLAADTKPTAPDGSTFYVADTPALYVMLGGTWYAVSASYVPAFSAVFGNR